MVLCSCGGACDFYSRSPCGERRLPRDADGAYLVFLSTLSLRRATYWSCVLVVGRAISIHALLAESDLIGSIIITSLYISIHALLAESDVFLLRKITITVDISIHALLAESD